MAFYFWLAAITFGLIGILTCSVGAWNVNTRENWQPLNNTLERLVMVPTIGMGISILLWAIAAACSL